MPEHILYGSRGSGSAVAELALEWAGLPYSIVNAAQWEPGPGFEALKKINPLAQIPTLVLPGGTVLTFYLSQKHGSTLSSDIGDNENLGRFLR